MAETPDLSALLQEFADTYLASPEGRRHLATYDLSRQAARTKWEEIQRAEREGRDVTDLVLGGVFPHRRTKRNRERGRWIHVATAVTGDVRRWFESAGWVDGSSWPDIAREVLRFLEAVIADPGRLGEACREFGASKHSKGIQAALLTPFMNALRPADYLIFNSNSAKALAHLRSIRPRRRLVRYPEMNEELQLLHDSCLDALRPLVVEGALTCDVLDQFFHWLVAVKGIGAKGSKKVKAAKLPPRDRQDPASARALMEVLYPDARARAACLEVFGAAVEEADRRRGSNWRVTQYRHAVRLGVGRQVAVHLKAGEVRLGLNLEGATDEERALVEGASVKTFGFSTQPPTALYTLPLEVFLRERQVLEPLLTRFIALASSTSRRVLLRSHSPGVLQYLEEELGRPLPQPAHARTPGGGSGAAVAIDAPRTVFRRVDQELSALLAYLDAGDIALPDIQRPFVWSPAKVRDLLDSMYRGYPVGYLLFWENTGAGTRPVGPGRKQRDVPARLIVDGQQRLTSLYAVLRSRPILDDEFRERRLEIAFRPWDCKFEVTDAAIRQDPEFVPDISRLWTSGKPQHSLVNDYLQRLRDRRTVSEDDEHAIGHNLSRLFELEKYPFTALEISADVDEEAVAEIFVRINSEGVKLKQADFILTLMSVFWEEGRAALERFCQAARHPPGKGDAPSPFNHLIEPSPAQLLRAAVAVGFDRARLRSVYQVLRAKDLETGRISAQGRDEQFARLRDAQDAVLDLTHWHQFLGIINAAGFRAPKLVTSETALTYSYAIYLLGKRRAKLSERELERLVGRWYWMAVLTSRYTGQSETAMESDLARLRDAREPEAFTAVLDRVIDTTLTTDFWTIRLASDLERASTRTPGWLAYLAAQCRLGTQVLFSDKRLWEVMDPSVLSKRKPVETHHLFPRAWLERNGYAERRHYNQVANFAHLEWPDNARVSDSPPSEYVPDLRERFSDARWERACRAHALPDDWPALDYPEFLARRRALMAGVVRLGFESLGQQPEDQDVHESRSTGTPTERAAWEQVETLEQALRDLVGRNYAGRWGRGWEEQAKAALGETTWDTIERNREKHAKQYASSTGEPASDVLQFCYLGQLGQLMMANGAWDMFHGAFRDKRELEDALRAILPVRNDRAHFRSVPERELTRCELAVEDVMRKLRALAAGDE